ncbi:tetraacyldisaccharide 4'-kinase [Ramlibacter tataouinensis]|uniref:tetraacyldisaccharide 4'-kinase n=1 Tax=Ramlibacter tataouinensis TaxID=94132 RepID=UPI0022F3F4FF|nr:tetraacyldisaccharide 4'-kinase [Ramlibacter tataouinensis]WBY02120.1 tetraacyldisaccharide 4'-kinase [Ramlibacter tataouinensis]
MRQALQSAWLRRGPLARALFPVSLLYGSAVRVRGSLYRAGMLEVERAPVPVVVVGNVVAGGAGKTPVVMAIAERLAAEGLKVGVVSRGHGRHGGDCLPVAPGSDPAKVGDEPLLVATRCRVPVFVAARRPQAVQALLQAHPGTQVILSDDGLQHRAMARDVEICVFDRRGVGNGWLLPAGPLREPWPRAVDLVLRDAQTPGIEGFVVRRRLAGYAWRADGERLELRALAAAGDCAALAGIAQPQAFFDQLRAAGIRLRETWALPDHHEFGAPEPWSATAGPLLCTEKDAVKLWRHRPDAWAVPLELEIDAGFWPALHSLLRPKLSSPDGPQTA